MLAKIASFLVDIIYKNKNQDKTEQAYLNFGIQLFLGVFFEIIILFFLAYLLNIFWPVVITAVSFLIIRPYAGGIHLPSYGLCMIISLILFLSIGLFTSFIHINQTGTIIIILSTSISGFYLISKYAPADTKTIPITDPERRKYLKNRALQILSIWTVLIFILSIISTHTNLIISSCLGIFSQLISTHPIFFYLVKKYLAENN